MQADDRYIYAVYWGKDMWGINEIPYVDIIHIFDWNGILIKKIKTNGDIDKIALDRINDKLYVTRPKLDEVYCIDLNEVIK